MDAAEEWLESGGEKVAPCRLGLHPDGRKMPMFGYPRDFTEVSPDMLTVKPNGKQRQKTNAILAHGSHVVVLDLDGSVEKATHMMLDGEIPMPNHAVHNGGNGREHWYYEPGEDVHPIGDTNFEDGLHAQLIRGSTGVFIPPSLHPGTKRLYQKREMAGEGAVWAREHSMAFFGRVGCPVSNGAPAANKTTGGCVNPFVLTSALKAIPNASGHNWIVVGQSLKGAFGDAALPLWLDWSREGYADYDEMECRRRWARFKPSTPHIGPIINLAKQFGWKPPAGMPDF